jgi:hypothetical protein
MKIKRVPIEEVQIWEKNPRNIKITEQIRETVEYG